MFTSEEILSVIDNSYIVDKNSNGFYIDNIVTDSRKSCKNSMFVALVGDNFDGHNHLNDAVDSGAVALCVSAKFAEDNKISFAIPIIVVPDTLVAYQTLAKAHRLNMTDCKIIAITGSSGKTSTKEILKTMLEEAFGEDCVIATEGNTNNHIGVPQNLLRLNKNHYFAIIEMGSNHIGEIEVLARIALPDISIITSIGNAHIEFLSDISGVALEKSAIFAGYPDLEGNIKHPVGIVPAVGEGSDVLFKNVPLYCFLFAPIEVKDSCNANIYYEYLGGNLDGSTFKFISKGNVKLSDGIQWGLHGKHQASNASAAMLAAVNLGASLEEIENALPKCKLPGMRMQIKEEDDITWINDAYNANPESVIATLDWLAEFADQKSLKIVLGDMLELGDDSVKHHKKILEHTVANFANAKVFAIGENISNALDSDLSKKIISFNSSQEAQSKLKDELTSGDTVFLKGSRGVALEELIPVNRK